MNSTTPFDENYIQDFLERNKIAILSTVNERGLPDAAPIFYVNDKHFHLFFATPVHTKKYNNLLHQNQVVLTITDELKTETLQIRGKAQMKRSYLPEMLKQLAQKLDSEDEFLTTLPILKHKGQEKVVIEVKPMMLRMRRYNQEKMEEKELIFD